MKNFEATEHGYCGLCRQLQGNEGGCWLNGRGFSGGIYDFGLASSLLEADELLEIVLCPLLVGFDSIGLKGQTIRLQTN